MGKLIYVHYWRFK